MNRSYPLIHCPLIHLAIAFAAAALSACSDDSVPLPARPDAVAVATVSKDAGAAVDNRSAVPSPGLDGGAVDSGAGTGAIDSGAVDSGAGTGAVDGGPGPDALDATAVSARSVKILFVGNSYTFGRVDPVMSYNAANVHDLTARFAAVNPTGTNPWEPHPWGGIPGIFKVMVAEAGLDYDVSSSTRNATSMRGHFLNIANSDWDLRGNVATQTWDIVILQGLSDEALPAGKGKNANLAAFKAYTSQFERFIHDGAAQTFTEAKLFGGLEACMASSLSEDQCNMIRTIPANPNASAATKVYITETWARPDMVFAHKITTPDTTSPSGAPIVDESKAPGILYYTSLDSMFNDLRASVAAAANPKFAGVLPVGDAFQRAVDQKLVQTDAFYNASGVATDGQPGDPINLWWLDRTHPSKYGSYLSALVQFGKITGRDPLSLGQGERAAHDLDIAPDVALQLQRVASAQLGF